MSIITENSNKTIKESPSEAANIAKKPFQIFHLFDRVFSLAHNLIPTLSIFIFSLLQIY